MNEHVCRAKKYGTDEWVYGYYIKCNYYLDEDYVDVIVPLNSTLYPRKELDEIRVVEPNTICCYTGRKDKNGIQIFEHDYVRTQYGRICEVVWFSSCMHCGWDLYPVTYINCQPPKLSTMWESKNLEVVGNKFDNTKLTKQDLMYDNCNGAK